MLVRVIRDLTSEEVARKLGNFEKEFGMEFERFEGLFFRQKLNSRLVRAYFEWAELVNSYKGYVEDGELDYAAEETKDFKQEQLAMLTSKRIELLCKLASVRVESINDLAQKVKRDVKNVHQDLRILRRFGFIKFSKRRGRALIPETVVKEITFLIR